LTEIVLFQVEIKTDTRNPLKDLRDAFNDALRRAQNAPIPKPKAAAQMGGKGSAG
jgi:hypothetical protein